MPMMDAEEGIWVAELSIEVLRRLGAVLTAPPASEMATCWVIGAAELLVLRESDVAGAGDAIRLWLLMVTLGKDD